MLVGRHTSMRGGPNGPADHRPCLEVLEPRRMLDAAAPVPMLQSSTADFVENIGQWDSDIRYLYRTSGANVAFTDQGLSFIGFRPGADETDLLAEAVNVHFDGAQTVTPVGLDRTPGRFNYHVGSDAARWVNGAHGYATVAYEGLYDGIDLLVSGSRSNLKYEYHVAAGADPADIVVRYDGAEDVYLDESGALHVDLGEGELIDDAPIAYQDIDGVRVAVDSAFAIGDGGAVSFALGAYDPSAELVIDPSLAWGAYIGGNGIYSGEETRDVALDANRCVYAVGQTNSASWVEGGWDTTFSGSSDAFVVRYTRKGTRLWATYLGGEGSEVAEGVTVSDAGSLYVVGATSSEGWTSGGVGDHTHGGHCDGFLVKLRQTGAHHWSCYMGGIDEDEAYAVACASNETIHVAGYTYAHSFPSTWITKGWDTTHNDGYDGFYARFWVNGRMLRGSYLGGSGEDVAHDIAVDGRGDVVVCGYTESTGWVTKGKDTTFGGNRDGFVTKFAAGGRHIWSRYVGGSGSEEARSVAIGPSNSIYVCGNGGGNWISGGWNTTSGNGYVYAMKTTGQHLWSSYLGGHGEAMTMDSRGKFYVVGRTWTAGWVTGGWDTSYSGDIDGFVVGFTAGGRHRWSSYMGGTQMDLAYGVAPDPFIGVHMVGETLSPNWLTGGWDPS